MIRPTLPPASRTAGTAAAPRVHPALLLVRQAARQGSKRAGLGLRLGGLRMDPPQRRLCLALLQEAAQSGTGQAVALPNGDAILTEAPIPDANRVMLLLGRMLGDAALEPWALPSEAGAAMAFVEAALTAPARPEASPEALEGLEARIADLPLPRVLRRRPLLRLSRGEAPALAFLRLSASAGATAEALGLAPGSDTLRHALDALARRMLMALPDPAQGKALIGLSLTAGPPLMLELPATAFRRVGAVAEEEPEEEAPEPPPARLVAALPLPAAADPAGFARLGRELRRQGWGIALRGLTASALALARPATIPADWYVLRWSEALRTGPPVGALARIDPKRLILIGCDSEQALDWGLGQGITQFGGRHLEAALAAARLAACPAGTACTRAQCATRAAATGADGRAGCANLPLLAASIPPGFGAARR